MAPHDLTTTHDGTEQTGLPALRFDPGRYAAELALFDLTDAQKHELLLTLWSIMRSFVELGFTMDVCGALWDDALPFSDDGDVM